MFSASVAHDLRTPLRAINGFANAVAEDYGDRLDDDGRRLLGRVVAGAVRMGSLIDALLALAKIARADMKPVPIDLREVARGIVDDLRATDTSRQVEVVMDGELETEGDPALLRALLQNLIGNAWKFSKNREDARIEITKDPSASPPVFCVKDNGAGFDMKHKGVLFTPFQRLHASGDFEGSGIGLATVDRIVRRHGGRIWVEAETDRGAAFSFTLRQ